MKTTPAGPVPLVPLAPLGPLAIVSAMHEELCALLPIVQDRAQRSIGGRVFHSGTLHGVPVVLALAGIGKVAAATTAAVLLQSFTARALLFTGVAGGLHPAVRVGDIVVAEELMQHDMDASPLFPRYEVPLTGRARFACDAGLTDALAAAASRCLQAAGPHGLAMRLAAFGISGPRVHRGLVASGDRFVSSAVESTALRGLLPDALAVEMEGGAVAQVCADFGVPCAVVRTVSDRADDSAHVDFGRFVAEVASVGTPTIVQAWLRDGRVGL
jgi:adenosylhomocysteine nucleosidase